jgi:hypothetical protein
MKHSVRLAQRSYRVAVPQYHRGRIQLLLPLYLRDSARPDLALTLERHGSWYRSATVLYPDWAYRHARLLSRPKQRMARRFPNGRHLVSPCNAFSTPRRRAESGRSVVEHEWPSLSRPCRIS